MSAAAIITLGAFVWFAAALGASVVIGRSCSNGDKVLARQARERREEDAR